MTYRRRATAVSAAVLSLAALSACGTKPTPLTSVGAGTGFEKSEATCYNDGDTLSQKQLVACGKEKATEVKVKDGEKVRFGVDKEIAETGWIITVGQQQTARSERTYRTIDSDGLFQASQGGQPGQAPSGPSDSVEISVVESADEAGTDILGVWKYTLVREEH